MKIGIVINSSWNIYNFRKGLILALRHAGHEIVAIAPRDDFSIKLTEELGFKYVECPMAAKASNPFLDLALIFRLKKIYKTEKLDLVLQYTIKPNIYGSIAAKMAGIPCINNVSGLGTVFLHDNLTTRIARSLYKLAFRFPEHIFFQNEFDKDLFVTNHLVKAEKTDLLRGSGIDLVKFKLIDYKKPEPFTFLVLSRLLKDKGIEEFARATSILKAKGLQFKSVIAGASDYSSSMGIEKKKMKHWTEKGVVEYVGMVEDVRTLIENAGCLVLPSYREGLPKSLLEGAAMGKPLIATDVPGCSDVVSDGINGLICKAKSVSSLAKAMEEILISSEDDLKKMGEAGRRLVEEEFAEEKVIAKYLEAIHQLNR